MDWLNGNWIWVLVAIAGVWFVMRRGGLHGHGMGGHGGSHGDSPRNGHGGSQGHGGSPGDGDAARPDAAGRMPTGTMAAAALDPVSGNPVRTDRARSAVFGGRAYYFETDETRKQFEAEPQRYASAAPEPVERPRRRRGC